MDGIDTRDTITFTLRTEEMVTNTTVKIIATISAAITRQTDDTVLQTKVRELMQAFMPDADWQYSGMTRATHPSAMEIVQLTAMARVRESAASHLDERAQQVKVQFEGCSFNISKILTDNSFPSSLVDEIESRMRLTLLKKAHEESVLINKSLGQLSDFRVARIVIVENADQHMMLSNSGSRYAMSAQSSVKTPYGGGFDDDGALGNTQKVQMSAEIVLARYS